MTTNKKTPKQKVYLTFWDQRGRRHRWTPKHVRQDLTQEELNEIAIGILELGIFQKKGIPYCVGRVKENPIETLLFDVEGEQPEG